MAEAEKNEEVKAPSNFIHDFIDEDLAEGKYSKIQTRFPPEPNGYLHIGHAKAICINFGVKEKYKGKCNLRLDDTNPIKEDTEYVDAIKEDIKWLGFDWDNLYYARIILISYMNVQSSLSKRARLTFVSFHLSR